jgi:hypothetical protein
MDIPTADGFNACGVLRMRGWHIYCAKVGEVEVDE